MATKRKSMFPNPGGARGWKNKLVITECAWHIHHVWRVKVQPPSSKAFRNHPQRGGFELEPQGTYAISQQLRNHHSQLKSYKQISQVSSCRFHHGNDQSGVAHPEFWWIKLLCVPTAFLTISKQWHSGNMVWSHIFELPENLWNCDTLPREPFKRLKQARQGLKWIWLGLKHRRSKKDTFLCFFFNSQELSNNTLTKPEIIGNYTDD